MKMKLLKVALILSILLFGIHLPAVEAATYDGETTVNLNIRSTPSTNGAVITTLPKGTKVKYGSYNRYWHKVYLNNRTYYAAGQYIRKLSSPSPSSSLTTQSTTSTGVTTENLNIRVSTYRSARIVTTLKKGTEVKYAVHNSSWAKVYLNGKTYYAAKAYIAPKLSDSTEGRQSGYANRDMKLFSFTNQSSTVKKVLPINTPVVSKVYNSSWSIVYIGNEKFYTATAWISTDKTATSASPTNTESQGYTNRSVNLFGRTSQKSQVLLVLPQNTAVSYKKYNSSWSTVHIGSKTYYTATAWISNEKTAVESPTTSSPTNTETQGYTNRSVNLFGRTSQKSQVLLVLPQNTAVSYKKYNSSWSTVHIGSKTYYTATVWISNEKTAVESPTTSSPTNTETQGYANRSVNLFGRTSQKSQVLLVLPKYTAVSYKKYNSSWSTVHIGSKTYYTATSWLTEGKAPSEPEASPKGNVYTNTPGEVLNVRSKASLDSTVVGKLPHGTEVTHYGTSNGFHKIIYNGRDGYISSDFVTSEKSNPTAETVIILDAGHGGKDPGAVNGSLYEKTIAFDVTKRVEAYLRSKYGYNVRLTRSTDVYLTLDERVEVAKSLRGDLFISLHVNAASSTAAKGIETFYSTYSAHSARSRVLASNIQSNLTGKMSGMSNRGVKSANYYVIRYNTMPAALVELGFISSPTDLTYLRSNTYRQHMAEGVAEGIAQYVRTYY